MQITLDMIKELRARTGVGIMDCKVALKETKGDIKEAIVILRKKGKEIATKKRGRIVREGRIGSYIHPGGRIGVLVEVNCETDFVARNDDFKEFIKEVAMQVAASLPAYISREEISPEVIKAEQEVIEAQIEKDKPTKIKKGIIAGKLNKYYQENCLLEQPYIRDPKMSIKDYLDSVIAKIGENIVIARFVRYELGEED